MFGPSHGTTSLASKNSTQLYHDNQNDNSMSRTQASAERVSDRYMTMMPFSHFLPFPALLGLTTRHLQLHCLKISAWYVDYQQVTAAAPGLHIVHGAECVSPDLTMYMSSRTTSKYQPP